MDDSTKKKAESIVSALTLEEKVALGVGADFWRTKALPEKNLPALTVSDGPSGLRYQKPGTDAKGMTESDPATCFPSLSTAASTWDKELVGKMGAAIGTEARALGVGVVLGPGLNIKRSPLCGRNFEYFSEDPYLTGMLATSYVRGVQSTGTGSCIKHFAVNSQEYKRFSNDCLIDERTLREIYLRAFEMVVKDARPEMVMSAYVMLNGIYCSDNQHLLREILRDEWGFDGAITTDWGGMHDRAKAYAATCDLAMPGAAPHLEKQALDAVHAGTLAEADIMACAERIASLAIEHAEACTTPVDIAGNRAVALKVAEEGQVLLANDGTLPLAKDAKVALIGALAKTPRYQGGGSSHINARNVETLVGLKTQWTYAAGYDPKNGSTTPALVDEAVAAARAAEVAVVVVGLPETIESEGYDRRDMKLPSGMDELVHAVAAAAKHTVVVVQSGSAVELPWEKQVSAVLWAGLGGEAGAEATVHVLEGDADASGRLAETWPFHAEDAPCMGWWGEPHRQAQYREGTFVGYRYYETAGVPVAHHFGEGLSYTTFAMADLSVHGMRATISVTNTGARAGVAVPEVYVTAPQGGLPEPALALAGFARIELAPQETKQVEIALGPAAFRVWKDGWQELGGIYTIHAGFSAHDLPLTCTFAHEGKAASTFADRKLAGTWYEKPQGKPVLKDFEKLYGKPVPQEAHHVKGTYDETDSLIEMAETSKAVRFMVKSIVGAIEKGYDDPSDPQCRMSIQSSAGCALFGLVNCAGGAMPTWLAQGLLNIANGHAPWHKA
ncbi:MAG: glycoside hydrolase family 3 C-terminal domain-containing protein [Atopobiaceae bacterium]